jgi:hypothetical protein
MIIESVPDIGCSVVDECIVMTALCKSLMNDNSMEEVGVLLLAVHEDAFNLLIQYPLLIFQLVHLILHNLLIALQDLDGRVKLG